MMPKEDKLITFLIIAATALIISTEVLAICFVDQVCEVKKYKSLYKEAVARYPQNWMDCDDVKELLKREDEYYQRIIACQAKCIE